MRNSRSGAPSNLEPTSSRSVLMFLSVNGTGQSYGTSWHAPPATQLRLARDSAATAVKLHSSARSPRLGDAIAALWHEASHRKRTSPKRQIGEDVTLIGSSYPFLDILWTTLIFFAWVIFIWIAITALIDVFRRHDM